MPNRVHDEIDRLVEEDEFMNRDQAIEKLLSKGIAAYGPADAPDAESPDEVFTQVVDDQHDPAMVSD